MLSVYKYLRTYPPCAFLLLVEPLDTQHNMYDLRPKLDTQRSGSKMQPQLSILNVQPHAWLTLACCSPLCGRLCCLSFNQTSSRRSFVGFFPWQKVEQPGKTLKSPKSRNNSPLELAREPPTSTYPYPFDDPRGIPGDGRERQETNGELSGTRVTESKLPRIFLPRPPGLFGKSRPSWSLETFSIR